MLILNDFAEGLKKVYPESILFSAAPKPDIDFITDFVKQQTDYLLTCQKKKYKKMNKSIKQ